MADERLKALDADHFWFDGVLIDCNQLRYEANSIYRKGMTDAQVHTAMFGLLYLDYTAEFLLGKYPDGDIQHLENWVKRLNTEVGLHTGWKEGLDG